MVKPPAKPPAKCSQNYLESSLTTEWGSRDASLLCATFLSLTSTTLANRHRDVEKPLNASYWWRSRKVLLTLMGISACIKAVLKYVQGCVCHSFLISGTYICRGIEQCKHLVFEILVSVIFQAQCKEQRGTIRLIHNHHHPVLCPLQNEGLSQCSPICPVLCEPIPLYARKFLKFQHPT